EGICFFILIAENVLNYHYDSSDYYEEWSEDVEDRGGWVVCLNLPPQTLREFQQHRLNRYLSLQDLPDWRIYKPYHLFKKLSLQLNG
ncbi:MAG: hypothetical protein EBV71_07875, partial [Chitinophagia bacterium]|nr:hypothetical protein [Chitinophagia bacterium]